MIYLGYASTHKAAAIADYQVAHAIQKTVVISHKRFPLTIPDADQIDYNEVIMYRTYYRLLQEIDANTLVVINECLRTQNRYDLTYNCIRNYLNQTAHVLVFQTLPQIDTPEDFMILFDFATQSRWKRQHFDPELIRDEAEVYVQAWPLTFSRTDVPTSGATRRKYAQERERLFTQIGAKDPHTLPRNLYLIGGRDKYAWLSAQTQPSLFADQVIPQQYVARNKRLGNGSVVTYDDVQPDAAYTVIEFPHRFIDWCDFVSYTGQTTAPVLIADLPVDHWYYARYIAWKERIHATYTSLRG